MTLIQTVFSNDRIIQVSDRRLTKGRGELVDDFYTKLVLWNSCYTVGFTGLARVSRGRRVESTAQWIAETLSEFGYFESGVEALRAEAARRMKKLPKDIDRRLAVVLAGFDSYHEGPAVACVTNMDMQTYTSADPTNFDVWDLAIGPGQPAGVHSIGAAMNAEQKKTLTTYVRRALKKGDGVNPAVQLMVENQRSVARTDKRKTVGPDALCVHIPRGSPASMGATAGPSVMSNLGSPSLPAGSSSFGYFDRNGWGWKQEVPLMAGGGTVMQTRASADPEHPDNQTISWRYTKVPNKQESESKP